MPVESALLRGTWQRPNMDDPQYRALLYLEAHDLSFTGLSDCMWEHAQQGHHYHRRCLAWQWMQIHPEETARILEEKTR